MKKILLLLTLSFALIANAKTFTFKLVPYGASREYIFTMNFTSPEKMTLTSTYGHNNQYESKITYSENNYMMNSSDGNRKISINPVARCIYLVDSRYGYSIDRFDSPNSQKSAFDAEWKRMKDYIEGK